ncbi:hypothetical protein AVEN_159441-1 [Araneus ventricosus]|uniref:Uncharacterized protein n=1 Tax=Araneus ventricosus TaxID=182803 RepID=A0A4Y2A2E6_ARAVE|nr:hypothetical protein AVEN_159441-1 [Araneus ventricosus]
MKLSKTCINSERNYHTSSFHSTIMRFLLKGSILISLPMASHRRSVSALQYHHQWMGRKYIYGKHEEYCPKYKTIDSRGSTEFPPQCKIPKFPYWKGSFPEVWMEV